MLNGPVLGSFLFRFGERKVDLLCAHIAIAMRRSGRSALHEYGMVILNDGERAAHVEVDEIA